MCETNNMLVVENHPQYFLLVQGHLNFSKHPPFLIYRSLSTDHYIFKISKLVFVLNLSEMLFLMSMVTVLHNM